MAQPLRADEVHACVHRVALSRGGPSEPARAEESASLARRRERAQAHRRATVAALAALHPEAVRPRTLDETLAALARGDELILTPRLPVDLAGRRVVSVQALVRTGREERFTYAPVIVKNHEVAEPALTRSLWRGDLARPRPADATRVAGVGARTSSPLTRSGLALGHATRVLGALGHGDPAARGAVVDRSRALWWFELGGDEHPRFNLAAYDRLYAERRAVLEAHDRWRVGAGDYPTQPYWHRECLDCPFAPHCAAELAARDDVSLVRFTTLAQQTRLREAGISTRRALAGLDPHEARRAREGVGGGSTATLAREVDHLDQLIYRARVAVDGTLRRRVEPTAMGCVRADVEVDVDMESYEDATYLWGAVVSVARAVPGVSEGYHAFATFDPLTPAAEAALFARFWTWLEGLRAACEDAGATFCAYCFWSTAEDGAMDRALERTDDDALARELAASLEAFRRARPARWIDLHDVVSRQIQTDGPLGLKLVARAAGFAWRDPSPSGEASIAWYERAVGDDPIAAEAHRRRLLEYNEDDCRATRALRDWLEGPARYLPHRDEPPASAVGP